MLSVEQLLRICMCNFITQEYAEVYFDQLINYMFISLISIMYKSMIQTHHNMFTFLSGRKGS